MPVNVLKLAGLAVLAVVLAAVVFRLLAPIGGTLVRNTGVLSLPQSALSAYDSRAIGVEYNIVADETGYGYSVGESTKTFSGAVILPPTPPRGGGVGGDLEDFEVTEYSVSIETRNKETTCADIAALKARAEVIFENANEHNRGCTYTFKVRHEHAAGILTLLESLDPKDLSENTYTIKRQLDLTMSEVEILERKLASLNETLENALDAYDEITALAARTENAEALAKIIDGKIAIIDRLTRERVDTVAGLERIERSRVELLDKLEYVYFHVNVFENKIVDIEILLDSWKAEAKEFVRDVNRILQDVSLNLFTLLLALAHYVLYFFVLLFIAKYLWIATKYVWKK